MRLESHMTSGSLVEANFVRLLHCTENLSTSENLTYYEFSTYFQKLQELLQTLANSKLKPAAEFLHIYKTRVCFYPICFKIQHVHIKQFKILFLLKIDQLSVIYDRLKQLEYNDDNNKSEFERSMRNFVQCDSKELELRNKRRKDFFFPLDPNEAIKWLDQDEIPPQNKDKLEIFPGQKNKAKPLPTHFIADAPNSQLRNLTDQEARRKLGMFKNRNSRHCFILFTAFLYLKDWMSEVNLKRLRIRVDSWIPRSLNETELLKKC